MKKLKKEPEWFGDRKYHGKLKPFKKGNTFRFLQCDESGKDAFVPSHLVSGWPDLREIPAGATFKFKMRYHSSKMQWQVSELTQI
jgi:hypothetical protein